MSAAEQKQNDAGTNDAPQDDAGASQSGGSQNGQSKSFTGEIKNSVRDAALEVVTPVAIAATTAAARYAVKKAPGLIKDQVTSKVAEAGGPKELAGQVSDKLPSVGSMAEKLPLPPGLSGLASKLGGGDDDGGGGGGGDAPSGTGRGRRLPVQEHVDVAVPIDVVYNQWTQFEEFPRFMHRVERVEQRDDTHLMWHENIWGVRRQWEAEITDQRPNERIAWRSTGGVKQVGVVSFSELADNLTRVSVTLDFQPQGLMEKSASGMRFSRRALVSDLMRFKAFIEMEDEETGAWRGTVEDGEVTDEDDEQEPQASDEDEDFEDDEEDLDDEEEDEDAPRASDEDDLDEDDLDDDDLDGADIDDEDA
jgi:uncharacterized membrane protein